MKVIYIGNFEPQYSTENDVKEAFEYLGWEVIALQENSMPTNIEYEDVDLILITSTWDNAIDLKQWISFVKNCADNGIPTATLHLDTFWGKSRGGRQWWLNPMFFTSHIFTADGDYQEEWELLGKKHTWLPPAVRHSAVFMGENKAGYSCEVAFVGSNGVGYHEDVWSYRRELVDNIRGMAKKNGWDFKNPGGDDNKIERNENMNNFYASAKVTVGDSLCLKKEDSKYWSDRVPEATGRGGFLIMPKIKALKDEGWNIPQYDWGNFKQLEEMIKHYLIDQEAREKIILDNYEETKKNHTYVNRVKTMLMELGLWTESKN